MPAQSASEPPTAGGNGIRSTVVVVTWRGAQHIANCLNALSIQDTDFRLLVIDNASDDGTAEILATHSLKPHVIRLPRNRGYAGGIHHALSQVNTEFVAWLNDDTEASSNWLSTAETALITHPRAAAVGSRMEYPDGQPQSLGVQLTSHGYGKDITDANRRLFSFCGGATLMRTELLREIGGVPADFFCYYEDTDTGWRFRLWGWEIIGSSARVQHLHGVSTRQDSTLFHRWNERNRLLTLARCAPWQVLFRELVRFGALTVMLPLRRLSPRPENFRLATRLRILASFGRRLPAALVARRRISQAAQVTRKAVWDEWAGR